MSAIIGVVARPSAQAASPVPQPPLDLGQTSFLDGEAGPGGLFEVIGNGYVAPQFTNASGGRVEGTNRQWIGTVIFHLAYVSSVPVAGGSLGAETLIPVSTLHLEVPGMPEATQGGLGDVTIAPFIQMDKNAGLATAPIDPAGYPGHGAYGSILQTIRSTWARTHGRFSPLSRLHVARVRAVGDQRPGYL